MVELTRYLGERPPAEVVFGPEPDLGYTPWRDVDKESEEKRHMIQDWATVDPFYAPDIFFRRIPPIAVIVFATANIIFATFSIIVDFIVTSPTHCAIFGTSCSARSSCWLLIEEVGKKKVFVELDGK